MGGVTTHMTGHSGYPNFSGRVIRVKQNSGKCYPILTLKNHYPTIRVPAISGSGSGIPDIPEVLRFATARRRCSFSPPDRCAAAGGEGGAAALATRDRRGREVEREREREREREGSAGEGGRERRPERAAGGDFASARRAIASAPEARAHGVAAAARRTGGLGAAAAARAYWGLGSGGGGALGVWPSGRLRVWRLGPGALLARVRSGGLVERWAGGLGRLAKNKQIDLSGLISGSSGNSGTVAQYPNYP